MASKVVALPIVGMVLSECAQVGLMIVSKAAMSDGMSSLLFIFYSNALASLLLLPISFIFHRTQRPALTFSVLCGFFLLGLLGCLIQVFGYAGIYYSSPTLATAMLNLVPAFTFILAVTLRMEILDWGSSTSLAKTVGTIASLVGAFVVTFYDGPSLLSTSSLSNVSYKKLLFQQSNWVIGGFLLLVDAVMTSVWVIIQASILKKYPAELILVFFYCFFVSILSAVVCLFVERDLSAWSLKSRTRLFSVLYSGVFGSAFQVGVSTWCLYRTGPVFVSMFKPLGIVISVAVGVIFSGETLFLGRLLGAIIIIVGFYSVLWGKATEAKIDKDLVSSLESSTDQEPLLQNSNEEHNSFVQKIRS
ncbi:WAT1-related protein At3g28050 isoform X2 [Morus notabilis]|uniref:WAT1-related protein At3g28050 isoform X2 n=1 Tax=Morus notabilis TaxID=981085 RepID=UPI000CED10C3|nr:WAT1-related protein At3g28050 isoform X2 [Morus notabilis]